MIGNGCELEALLTSWRLKGLKANADLFMSPLLSAVAWHNVLIPCRL